MITISVAMATYNGSQFLNDQLRSIASQTLQPFELVVMDDCSSDNTLAILRRFAKEVRFPVWIHQNEQRLGYKKNFMKCAGICRGSHIAFCDQDDIWYANKLEFIQNTLKADDDTLLVYHNSDVFLENANIGRLYEDKYSDQPQTIRSADIIFSPLGFTITVSQSLVMFSAFHAESKDPNDFYENEAHDQWYYFLSKSLGRVVYLPSCLANYRQHGKNLHGWGKRTAISGFINNVRAAARRQFGLWLCARRRLQTLNNIALLDGGFHKPRLIQSLREYECLKMPLQLRCVLFTSKHLRVRLMAFIAIWRAGYYNPRYGAVSFGFKGAARDIILGVILGSLLRGSLRKGCRF